MFKIVILGPGIYLIYLVTQNLKRYILLMILHKVVALIAESNAHVTVVARLHERILQLRDRDN